LKGNRKIGMASLRPLPAFAVTVAFVRMLADPVRARQNAFLKPRRCRMATARARLS